MTSLKERVENFILMSDEHPTINEIYNKFLGESINYGDIFDAIIDLMIENEISIDADNNKVLHIGGMKVALVRGK